VLQFENALMCGGCEFDAYMMKLAWWIHGMVYGKFVKIKILFEHLL
jgi:hypothetical protein